MRIVNNEPDLILLTEVIPNAQANPIPPALLSIPEYTMYINFDPTSCGLGGGGRRGICIYVHRRLHA